MPTSKIETREQAAKAFMEGAYFKVGDRFISPDEIVTAQKNEQGEPIFKLTTGETVAHKRFDRGSVGHFLFEQLRKVQGRYEEIRRPSGFNFLFQGSGTVNRINVDGSLENNITNDLRFPADDTQINPDAEIIAGEMSSAQDIAAHTFQGDLVGKILSSNSQGQPKGVSVNDSGNVFGLFVNQGNGAGVYKLAPDGTVTTVVEDTNDEFNPPITEPTVGDFTVMENTAPMYAAIVFQLTDSFDPDLKIGRLDLSASGPTIQKFTNTDEDVERGPVYGFGGSVYYLQRGGGTVRKIEDVGNLNSPVSTAINFGNLISEPTADYFRITPEKLVFKDTNGKNYVYDRTEGKIVNDYGQFSNVQDGYTDLSVL